MALFLLSLAALPTTQSLSYDALILNVVYQRDGDVAFCQIGGLDLHDSEYRWQWWRIVRSGAPRPHRINDLWVYRWYDKKEKRRYTVRSGAFFEAHSTRDLEIDDRKFLPESKRRGLR